MKATFKGVPGEEHDSLTMYGQDFPLGKAVEVRSVQAQRKLARHPHFSVSDVPEDIDSRDTTSGPPTARTATGFLYVPEAVHVTTEGPPAGTATPIDPSAGAEGLMTQARYSQTIEDPAPVPDGDGVVYGSNIGAAAIAAKEKGAKEQPTHDELLSLAEAVGLKVNKGWDDARLSEEIEKKAGSK